jgi:hypothetical protein
MNLKPKIYSEKLLKFDNVVAAYIYYCTVRYSIMAKQINLRIAGVIYAPNQISSFYKFNRGVGCVRTVNLLLCVDKKNLKLY